MTFKNDGKLMTDEELKPLFLNTTLSKFTKSKYYRAFVIQFQLGVFPKLTLTEGQTCDSSYTWKYKDPRNSSVTWHYQKKFVENSYYDRNDQNLKYCDYQRGLVCNQFTSKCECPEGSKMQEIEQGSSEKRCLLEKDEICALIDIAHGTDPNHKTLARDMPKIIFNLEKPVSCKVGTQCRFKNRKDLFPRCYDSNSGPFAGSSTSWTVVYGRECAIGLYANPGSCSLLEPDGVQYSPTPGLVCYNFGPLRSNPQSSNRTGYCAHELGSMGNARAYSYFEHIDELLWHPYINLIGFVHVRSTPLRGDDLYSFNKKYFKKFRYGNGVTVNDGDRCSTQLTLKSKELWKYFIGLERDPPPGQDYVPEATKDLLEEKLDELIALAPSISSKSYCRPVWNYERRDNTPDYRYYPPQKCVTDGRPLDQYGNDGNCADDPGNLLTKPIHEKLRAYLGRVAGAFREERLEKKVTLSPGSEQILHENPDNCTRASDCPEEYECYEDLRDELGIYDSDCKLKDPSQALNTVCRDLSENSVRYSKCESRQLNERIKPHFENIVNFPKKLGRGEKCQLDIESKLRTAIKDNRSVKGNKYNMLKVLQDEKDGYGQGFCDYTRLLECSWSSGFTCQCFDNTQPRVVTRYRDEYQSDYCYKTSGDCQASSLMDFYKALTTPEKEKFAVHYGQGKNDCKKDTNLCVFVKEDNSGVGVCTTENTGTTDGIKEPSPPPRPGGSGGGWNRPPGNGWGEAGVGRLCVSYWSLIGAMIMTTHRIWM